MHVECSACGARYTIADEKIPVQGARVRCRKCHAVFPVEKTGQPVVPVELSLIPPYPQPQPPAAPALDRMAPPAAPAQAPAQPVFSRGFEHVPSSAAPGPGAPVAVPAPGAPVAAPAPGAPVAAPAPNPAQRLYTSAGIPQGLPEADRVKHERARRLARVLASDIAIYNKEKRDRGIKDGNLVAILGYEIKKSWGVYKERVTSELANSTPYFRDALNEMLAEGKKIF